jgi:hypothetical protein
MPYRLIYSSEATEEMARTDLEQMLVESRLRNAKRGITGVLVFVDGVFLQILEGERDDVEDLMTSIRRDPRHRNIKVFHEEEIDRRAFPAWRMAYLSPRAEEVSAWAGLEGAASLESVLATLRSDPDRVPKVVVGLVEAVSTG